MAAASIDPNGHGSPTPARTRAQRSLPRRAYGFRILGMGLASLPLAAVMHELHSGWPAWAWMALSCLAWPHLAYFLTRRSADPFLAELRNFVVDSAIAGSWVPLMHFNLLPSAVLLSVVSADKINAGVRGLLWRSLPPMFGSLLVVGLLTGFAFQPMTSMTVIASCLPIMIIHTLAVSATSYRLVRRVQSQNLKLEELSRTDTLTGLYARGHWEVLAQAALRESESGGDSAMLVLDIDRFKEINDRHGHAVGDDVLSGIADLVRRKLPRDSHAGRLGGDEFAIVFPHPQHVVRSAAEQLLAAVRQLEFPNAPDLRCTISAGIAGVPATGTDLRSWIEIADRALYRAKQAGRDRVISAD